MKVSINDVVRVDSPYLYKQQPYFYRENKIKIKNHTFFTPFMIMIDKKMRRIFIDTRDLNFYINYQNKKVQLTFEENRYDYVMKYLKDGALAMKNDYGNIVGIVQPITMNQIAESRRKVEFSNRIFSINN